jgi:cytochrome c-type biogenesis protein CcmE
MQMSWTSNSTSISGYDKLSKGDVGYGGNAFAEFPDGKQVVAEGLLAKKLRDLGVGLSTQPDLFDDI